MSSLKLRIKLFLMDLGLFSSSKGITILTYHGLVDTIDYPRLQRNFHTIAQFEAHISFLKKKNYHFISGAELVNYVDNPKEIGSEKMVCITFDDGYQNNLDAIAILKKHNLSGIFFISTAVIDSKESIWTVNLSLLLLEGEIGRLYYNDHYYELNTQEQRNDLFQLIRMDMKKMDATTRKDVFDSIKNQFPLGEIDRLVEQFPCFKMLSWDEIRSVQSDKIQFHSHGHDHEIHHSQQSVAVMKSEIEISKELLEQETGKSCYLFGYPNGNYNEKAFTILEEAGYACALQLNEVRYKGSDHRFSISRITPNGKLEKFKQQILF